MPGFLAELRIDRCARTVVAVLANATTGLDSTTRDELMDVVADETDTEPASWTPVENRWHNELLGPWYWGPRLYTLTATADADVLHLDDDQSADEHIEIVRSDDRWYAVGGYFDDEDFVIVRSPDRTITQLRIASIPFTRTPYDEDLDQPD